MRVYVSYSSRNIKVAMCPVYVQRFATARFFYNNNNNCFFLPTMTQNNFLETRLPCCTDRTRTRPEYRYTHTSRNAVEKNSTCRIGYSSRLVRASRYARWTWACWARSRCPSSITGVSARSKSSAATSATGNT